MPEAAKGTSKKSAEAFVLYAVDVLNYGTQSLQPRAIRELGTRDCAGCESLAQYVGDIRAAKGGVRGGDLNVQEVFVVGNAASGPRDLLIEVVVNADPQQVRETRAGQVIQHPGGPASFDFVATPVGDNSWKLAAIEQVAE